MPTITDSQRLLNSAEAFYFAGLLCTVRFNASKLDDTSLIDAESAAIMLISSGKNSLGAPPLVNFAFALELYLKFLVSVSSGGSPPHGHKLNMLYDELRKTAPNTADSVVQNHHYCRGCQIEFREYIDEMTGVFVKWRYAYEEELLCGSHDSLFVMANAFRATIGQYHPAYFTASPFR